MEDQKISTSPLEAPFIERTIDGRAYNNPDSFQYYQQGNHERQD